MPPPSDPAEDRPPPSDATPSEYVLLEAELAAGGGGRARGGGEAERVAWVSRRRPAPRGAVTLVVERDAAVRARMVGALRRGPYPDRGQVGGPAFDVEASHVEGAAGVPGALERLQRGGVGVVVCGDVGPEEDAWALHEALRRDPAFEATPLVYFAMAGAHVAAIGEDRGEALAVLPFALFIRLLRE